jgi:hypothetical protein
MFYHGMHGKTCLGTAVRLFRATNGSKFCRLRKFCPFRRDSGKVTQRRQDAKGEMLSASSLRLVPFAPNLLDQSMRPLARRNVLSRIRSASRLFSNHGQPLVRLRSPGSRRPWSPVVSLANVSFFPSHAKPQRGQGAKTCPSVTVLSPFASWRLCVRPLSVAAGPHWVYMPPWNSTQPTAPWVAGDRLLSAMINSRRSDSLTTLNGGSTRCRDSV